jgi:RNA recognition motif-containing protein
MNNNEKRCSLFIGDLSFFCTELDISNAFESYGDLLEIKIKRNQETNRNLSYGFIRFAASSNAKKALDEMDGRILCGRPMRSNSCLLCM